MKINTRILYFSSQFPTRVMPQMGMFSVQRIRALTDGGCEVIVVSPILLTLPARMLPKPARLYRWLMEQIKLPHEDCVQGIQAYYPKWVWFPKGLFGWYTSYFLYLQVRRRVNRLIEEFRPDVILSSWLPDGIAAAKIAGAAGLPSVAIADGSDVNFLSRSYPGWGFARSVLNRPASTVVFVSKALQKKANNLGLYGGNSAVLYNAVNTHLFKPAPAHNNQGIFSLLSVGRLVPVKGYATLLEAFAQLYRHLDQKARLVIVGEGPLLDALCRQADELGISPVVHFAGSVKHGAIVEFMQQTDVFCLPSFSEGSPAVLVEALACGKPVVASDVGGVGEILNEQSGILVPPGNHERLFQALLQAKDRSWDQLAIRQEIERHYSWERWTEAMSNLIASPERTDPLPQVI